MSMSSVARTLARSRLSTRVAIPHARFIHSSSARLNVTPGPLHPEPQQKQSFSRRFFYGVGVTTVLTVVGGAGLLYYYNKTERQPGDQLPFDPSKKTLVILGSGWGATSLLNKLDTENFNVVVVSPKNFFLFTPLLPSVAVGTLSPHSILQPTRYITRHKKRAVKVIEAEAKSVDPVNKTVTFSDTSPVQGTLSESTIPYDYLVYAVGAEVQTFGIPGVRERAFFMKEIQDAERMQNQFMDCLESAAFPGQSEEEQSRLLHTVVVGGGPTGVELSGELHDFLEDDLKQWYPELASKVKITLIEALPNVLPSFSKKLIDYTESTFKESKIDILTKTMVKEVKEKSVVVQMPDKSIKELPCGMVVWAAGNTVRQITRDLMSKLPDTQTNRRGLTIDDHLQLVGSGGSIFAIGDCTASSYAPTAQVASQQGAYLARVLAQVAKRDAIQEKLADPNLGEQEKAELNAAFEKVNKIRMFHYSHQGSLAYIGSEKAIADLPFFNGNIATGGVATYMFWRSAYISSLFSFRNRALVAADWLRTKVFGRDVSRD